MNNVSIYDNSEIENPWGGISSTIFSNRITREYNKEIYEEVVAFLRQNVIPPSARMVRFYLQALQSFHTAIDMIPMMDLPYLDEKRKTLTYRLPLFTLLCEGCISNIMRLLTKILDESTPQKDYSKQSTLGQMKDALSTSGLSLFCNSIDINLRNAINHGAYYIGGLRDSLNYRYKHGGVEHSNTISCHELTLLNYALLQTAAAALLSLVDYVKGCDWRNMDDDYCKTMLLGLALSNDKHRCTNASIADINGRQINLTFESKISSSDDAWRAAMALLLATFKLDDSFVRYLVSFEGDRLSGNMFRATKNQLLAAGEDPLVLQNKVKSSGEWLWIDPPKNNIPSEAMFFLLPDKAEKQYEIRDLEDISTEDSKRLKANVIVRRFKERKSILEIANECTEWIKHIYTVEKPRMSAKHGAVNADQVYLTLYWNDPLFHDSSLSKNNENFIGISYYCENLRFPIITPRLTGYLEANCESLGKTRFYWRNSSMNPWA